MTDPVEIAARAMCKHRMRQIGEGGHSCLVYASPGICSDKCEAFYGAATAALSALTEAGYEVALARPDAHDTQARIAEARAALQQAIIGDSGHDSAIHAHRAAVREARNAALEEAAREAETEGWGPDAPKLGYSEREEGARDCAERITARIRKMKEAGPG